jgi:hypothetical protein
MKTQAARIGLAVVIGIVLVLYTYSGTVSDAATYPYVIMSGTKCAAEDGTYYQKLCILPDGQEYTNLSRNKCKKADGTFYRSVCELPTAPAPTPVPDEPAPTPVPDEPAPTPVPDEPAPTPVPTPTPVPDDGRIPCTTANQSEVCPSGSTSATGPGVCVDGYCEYLYRQACTSSDHCDEIYGSDTYAICCRINSESNRCLNPSLCRYSVEEFEELFGQ